MISELPLLLFTTIGGLSAGLVIAMAAFPQAGEAKRPWLAPLCALVMLGAAMLCVVFHLKRPQLLFLALANPAAGIAQEAYCGIALGVLLLVWTLLVWKKGQAPKALTWVCAAVALVMTFVMGCAYVVNVGIPAWANWTTVPLFVAGDVAMGLGLWALLCKESLENTLFDYVAAVFDAIAAVSMVLCALHFGTVGQSGALFYVGAVVAIAAGVVAFMAAKKPQSWSAAALFACIFVGVLLSRWAFYAACAI